jgi:hypothetical protein
MVLASVDGMLGNADSLDLPGKTMTNANVFMVDTQATATTLFVIFAVLVPVSTLLICLVVFLKRRHL